jgi:hypothetical protein
VGGLDKGVASTHAGAVYMVHIGVARPSELREEETWRERHEQRPLNGGPKIHIVVIW